MKKPILICLFSVLLFSGTLPVRAQFYLTGEDPARLKWNQIQAGPFKVIYPRGTDSLAFRYAFLLEKAAPYVAASLQARIPDIPVILHPYSLNSNGLVTWTPSRMELITTPFPNGSNAQNWDRQLVLHELRHVAQMQRAGEHFFEPFSWFTGEISEALSVGLYFGRWLLEGDATFTETLLSYAGRGREASFLMPYKTYFATGKDFSLDKWKFGSYKHKIPNAYALGYLKFSTAENISSEYALANIFTDVTRKPYWPFEYDKSFKRNWGENPVHMWYHAKDFYSRLWENQEKEKIGCTYGRRLNKPVKDYVSYRSPIIIADSVGVNYIYAVKSSMAQTRRLVRMHEGDTLGKETTICLLGEINSMLTGDGRNLFWSETVSGHRWAYENFSMIIRYDTWTHKKKILSYGTRFFNPVPSPDGGRLAVVRYRPEGGSELHILDPGTGVNLKKIQVPRGEQLSELAWQDSTHLYGLLTGEQGKGIYRFSLSDEKCDTILPPFFYSLFGLRTENGQLFFQSDFNHNTDNIFSLDPATGKTLQLTQARFGAFDPFPGQNALRTRLYYSDYTATGYQLTEISVDSLLNTQADLTARQTAVLPVNRTPRFIVDTLRVPEELSYPVKKYNKVLHAARVHSWLPFYFNFNELESFSFQKYHETVSAGVTLMSQNSLGTLYSILGYSYHNRFHSGHFHVNYSGLLPVFSLEVNVNDRFRTQNYTRQENNKIVFVTDTIRAPLLEARLYSYIPFTFNSHGWQRGFIPSIQYRFTNDSYYVREKQRYINKGMLQAGIRYYQVQNRAERDIFPRLGMGLNLQWGYTPGTQSLFSTIGLVQAYGYIPGLFRNQALKIDAAYQKQQVTGRYFYLGSFLSSPRGMKEQVFAPHIFRLTADYAIPIWPGDLSVPGVLYLKRIQLIPFSDHMYARAQDGTVSRFHSYGTDLVFDFHIFRIGPMLSAGVRYALSPQKTHTFEFLFSMPAF